MRDWKVFNFFVLMHSAEKPINKRFVHRLKSLWPSLPPNQTSFLSKSRSMTSCLGGMIENNSFLLFFLPRINMKDKPTDGKGSLSHFKKKGQVWDSERAIYSPFLTGYQDVRFASDSHPWVPVPSQTRPVLGGGKHVWRRRATCWTWRAQRRSSPEESITSLATQGWAATWTD